MQPPPLIRAPVFVDANGDLLAFASVAELLRAATPAAIRGGAFPLLYDADGRLLRLTVRVEEYRLLGLLRRTRDVVELQPAEHVPTHEAALRALLLRFVSPRAPAAAPAHPLAGLVRT